MSGALRTDLNFKLSVGVPLLVVAAGAWYLSITSMQSSSTMGSSSGVLPIATMSSVFSSPNTGIISVFLAVWVVGMVAMMFPAMIPVMLFYLGMMEKEGIADSRRFLRSACFLGGYLSLYALLGFALFMVVYVAFQLGGALSWLSSLSVAAVVTVLAIAGIWQLTPFKERSLSKCISPMGFFLSHFKKDSTGAFQMGAEHGVYCVGCCWLYMLVMLAVAAMSLLSMAVLSGLIVIEKAFLGGYSWFKWASAGIFFTLAVLVALSPGFLTSL